MATKLAVKPTITILYDADEERVRDQALERGEKFPTLVCNQIDDVLTKRGYTIKRLAANPPIKRLVRQLEDDNSELIINICESLGGDGAEERRIASMLELLDKRFTGSGSIALTLAGDKSLAKKLFEFHQIRSPDFAIIAPGHVEGNPKLNSFPVIVKPIATDASIGINAKSVVYSVQEMMERVFAIHEEFHSPALVEQYIDGREIYIGLLGNPPTVLTPIEWDLSKLPDGMPRIAGSELKWEDWKNPELKAAKEFVPEDLLADEPLMAKIRDIVLYAWKSLQIRDYARIDLRLTPEGEPYVIEVNPNPWLDKSAEFAMAARKSRPDFSYGDLIERIVEVAMLRPMREKNGRS
ncbi:MAG TPA: D-alanine--D-alanine ligase [Thermoanaerobaculia bacterium]|nr:D-alanine--D-alanine ligase [Thermoanaerobaculia bacterium]